MTHFFEIIDDSLGVRPCGRIRTSKPLDKWTDFQTFCFLITPCMCHGQASWYFCPCSPPPPLSLFLSLPRSIRRRRFVISSSQPTLRLPDQARSGACGPWEWKEAEESAAFPVPPRTQDQVADAANMQGCYSTEMRIGTLLIWHPSRHWMFLFLYYCTYSFYSVQIEEPH